MCKNVCFISWWCVGKRLAAFSRNNADIMFYDIPEVFLKWPSIVGKHFLRKTNSRKYSTVTMYLDFFYICDVWKPYVLFFLWLVFKLWRSEVPFYGIPYWHFIWGWIFISWGIFMRYCTFSYFYYQIVFSPLSVVVTCIFMSQYIYPLRLHPPPLCKVTLTDKHT